MKHRLMIAIAVAAIGAVTRLDAQVLGRDFMDAPIAKFSDADLALFRAATQEALDNRPDGSEVAWGDPDSRVSGTVTPIKTERDGDRQCRLLQIVNSAAGTSEGSKTWFCRDPQGKWKATSPEGARSITGQ